MKILKVVIYAHNKEGCCDVCIEDGIDLQLDILKSVKATAKRRKALRVIDNKT